LERLRTILQATNGTNVGKVVHSLEAGLEPGLQAFQHVLGNVFQLFIVFEIGDAEKVARLVAPASQSWVVDNGDDSKKIKSKLLKLSYSFKIFCERFKKTYIKSLAKYYLPVDAVDVVADKIYVFVMLEEAQDSQQMRIGFQLFRKEIGSPEKAVMG